MDGEAPTGPLEAPESPRERTEGPRTGPTGSRTALTGPHQARESPRAALAPHLADGLGGPAALRRLSALITAALEPVPPGTDPRDLEQDVWLRLLEHVRAGGAPVPPARWLRTAAREARDAVRADPPRRSPGPRLPARPAARSASGDNSWDGTGFARSAEQKVLDAELRETLREAVPRLPGRCPGLVAALLDQPSATYRELARELEISQKSIGPLRSRCLACLRRILAARGCSGR